MSISITELIGRFYEAFSAKTELLDAVMEAQTRGPRHGCYSPGGRSIEPWRAVVGQ
jgi:hypothetical protein